LTEQAENELTGRKNPLHFVERGPPSSQSALPHRCLEMKISNSILCLFLLSFFTWPAPGNARERLTLAVLPFLGSTELVDRFTPLTDHLGEQLGMEVILRSLARTLPVSELVFVASNTLPAGTVAALRQYLFELGKSPSGLDILTGIQSNITGLVPAADEDYHELRIIMRELEKSGVVLE
jgi:ABC-type phosphate/phosphonate transport system substrate-binding protein